MPGPESQTDVAAWKIQEARRYFARTFFAELADRLDCDDWEGLTDEQWSYIRNRGEALLEQMMTWPTRENSGTSK